MKVCIINNFPPYSGAGRVTYESWRALKKYTNVRADLYCTHAMSKEELHFEENRGVFFLHPFVYKGYENLSRFFIYFVDRYLLPKDYDVYHVANQMIGFMVTSRRPSVVTLFDLYQIENDCDQLSIPFLSTIYRRLIQNSVKAIAKADAIICISEFTKAKAIALLQLPPEKLYVVYSGVNHSIFKPSDKNDARKKLKLPLNKKIILHVGSEIKRKNVAIIIEAFSKCSNDSILVRLGPSSPEIKTSIDHFGLASRVLYRESFFEEEVALYYAAADVMVFPSLEEGFGLPIIEAMASGCPVITTQYGAMKEVAGDGAILVDPEDSAAIALAINNICQGSKRYLSSQIKKGINRAAHFTWESYAKKLSDIYAKVLQ